MDIIKDEKRDFFFKNYKKGEKINVKKTSESIGVTRKTIYSWMREINSEKNN